MYDTGVGRTPDIWLDSRVVEYVADLMADGVQKYTIKAEIQAIAGKSIGPPQYEALRRKARAVIRERSNTCLSEFQDDIIQSLRRIVADEDTKPRDKVLAIKELNSVLGIGGQFKREISEEAKAEKVRSFMKASEDNVEG